VFVVSVFGGSGGSANYIAKLPAFAVLAGPPVALPVCMCVSVSFIASFHCIKSEKAAKVLQN
jgi:hypothetical protein